MGWGEPLAASLGKREVLYQTQGIGFDGSAPMPGVMPIQQRRAKLVLGNHLSGVEMLGSKCRALRILLCHAGFGFAAIIDVCQIAHAGGLHDGPRISRVFGSAAWHHGGCAFALLVVAQVDDNLHRLGLIPLRWVY